MKQAKIKLLLGLSFCQRFSIRDWPTFNLGHDSRLMKLYDMLMNRLNKLFRGLIVLLLYVTHFLFHLTEETLGWRIS
jgi:hypothetical protein